MATQARIVGSGYTMFTINNQPIAFCEMVADTGEELVNPTPERIHPIYSPYPVEICSCEATNGGQLTLTIRETWDHEVWDNLPVVDPKGVITIRELVNKDEFAVVKIIQKPNGEIRGKKYLGCRITAVQTGETVNVGTITIPKTVTITYRYTEPL
jgi:hypothetical protein